MNQTLTSYVSLFNKGQSDSCRIDKIEIPLIQRDYAQGRQSESVERVRKDFINALYAAVMPGGDSISLDFIYGDVIDHTLYPLDGQQRLTTLFLLHWFLCWRAGIELEGQSWRNFSYATRASARQFCKALVINQPPAQELSLRNWIIDQPWYFHGWHYDSSISAMLVMLEALEHRFSHVSDEEIKAAWKRLIDPVNPAISFHLLPAVTNKLTDDLYIKMNSRGKPLTPFENFKAQFEALLNNTGSSKAKEFASKIDNAWADTLWLYKDADHLIDDQFMRYFRFVFDLCTWREGGRSDSKINLEALAQSLFDIENINSPDHLDFLFQAFDVWTGLDIDAEFSTLLSTDIQEESSTLVLFNPLSPQTGQNRIDLFGGCCRYYGKSEWSQAHSLLLYAVLLNRIHGTTEFPRQLRIVRNLIESSGGGEMRIQNMATLLNDVQRIVVGMTLEGVSTFNQRQVANEKNKATLLAAHPELQKTIYKLEDCRVLRGSLAVFSLDPSGDPALFTQRAYAFLRLFNDRSCWSELTGALLALGDYSRKHNRYGGYRLLDLGSSSNESVWRELLMSRSDTELTHPLTSLLDYVAQSGDDLEILKTVQKKFIEECEKCQSLNWRYYLVKYPSMRKGISGRYAVSQSGYSICMLDKTVMRSYYRDPYLSELASMSQLNIPDSNLWFYGYETEQRWLERPNAIVTITSVDVGWQMGNIPSDPNQLGCLSDICDSFDITNYILRIPQQNQLDTVDRLQRGVELILALNKSGL